MSKDMNEYNEDEWDDVENIPPTLKDKFSPETHTTRCGKSWRWLDVKGSLVIAVMVEDNDETIFYVTSEGKTYDSNYDVDPDKGYDLIPIQQPPVDLPTNLRPEVKWTAMDSSGYWYGYSKRPIVDSDWEADCWNTDNVKNFNIDCMSIPKDPAGWENSLHERVGDTWERVL